MPAAPSNKLNDPQRVRESGAYASPDREEVAFAVLEPGTFVPRYLRDPVHSLQSGQVVLLEDHSVGAQLSHGRLDIIDVPTELRVGSCCLAARLEQYELSVPTTVA